MERCQRDECGKPSEVVLTVVVVDLTDQAGDRPATKLALCRRHADAALDALAAR